MQTAFETNNRTRNTIILETLCNVQKAQTKFKAVLGAKCVQGFKKQSATKSSLVQNVCVQGSSNNKNHKIEPVAKCGHARFKRKKRKIEAVLPLKHNKPKTTLLQNVCARFRKAQRNRACCKMMALKV